MLVMQRWESRRGYIPKRKGFNAENPRESFLYLKDFPTVKWGDTIGLSLVDFGVVLLLEYTWPLPFTVLVSSIGAALLITFCYHVFSLYRLPYQDSMYPAPRTVSRTGKLHLVYMLFQLSIAAFGFWVFGLTLTGEIPWSPPIVLGTALGFFGGAFYFSTWFLNVIKLKRFG